MQCPRCRADNRPERRFCGECGFALAQTCPACGFLNQGGERFCGGCGAAMAAQAASPPTPSPQTYTPAHLAEKILTSRAALEGERKQVTVLFADLKGSMELLADRDPEDGRKILDPVLQLMMDAVHRYEGTVNQVMGDGIMALFGAPLAHEDHAVRACYAALRMQELIRRYAEDARRRHGVNVQIRVGLNSGEVVVRAIGSDLHMDYTAVGQTTHLAARLEQFASPGSILLTSATLTLVEGFVAVTSLGPVPVKGLADAVEVYEVTGAGHARTRLQAAVRRGLTRFVGRDAELEQLRRAQQLAGNGHGQVAAVVGEAGVGKSRLVHEFTHSHRLHGWLVLESTSVSYGKATSYLPVIDLLKGYVKIQDRDDHREMREKVTGKLLSLDESLRPALPALLALLDVPVDDAAWRALDPAQRRRHTLDAVRQLLLREAREQPLLLVFEDLHWVDSETQAVLDALVESLASARLLLLVSYRPEYRHAWGSKTYYSQLRLDALPPESTGELLDALLGHDPGLAALKQLLVKRGNPFFLEETVRTLVETKALAGEPGRYRLAHPLEAIHVPATVQAMLAARIDRLPPEEKRLLQTASVVGKSVPFGLLQAIAGLPDDMLRRGLDHLQAAEFLYETALYPDLEHSFKHALTHEVTYGGLLHERRRELHARIVDAIETLYPDRVAEHVERLASHAFRGEAWEKALAYGRQAGARAMARSANREALNWLEQALTALGHLPESGTTREQAVDLRLDLRNCLFPLGELKRVFGHLGEAKAHAEALGDQRRLGRVLASMCGTFALMGDPDHAFASGECALNIATALGDLGLELATNQSLGLTCVTRGEYRHAMRFYRKNLASLEGDQVYERFGTATLPSVIARAWLGWCLAELGELAEAIAHGQEAVRIAEAANHPFSLIQASFGLGFPHLRRGDFRAAIGVLERGLGVCQAWNLTTLAFHGVGAFLGSAYALGGRLGEARPLLERVVEQSASIGVVLDELIALIPLGEVCLRSGQPDDAARLAARALALSRDHAQRGHEAYALRLLGEIAAQPDRPELEAATAHYAQATTLAAELGMRPLIAHCHLGLGRLCRRTGKQSEAQDHLGTATAMFRDMEMRFWQTQAEREMAALG